jgi:hypothetical protein
MAVPLMLAVRRLADVLERENAALTVMDFRRATALLAEKSAAVADLAASGGAAGKPALTRADVDFVVRSLEGVTAENRRLLSRAIVVQQRVIGIVARAAATAARPPTYGAPGRRARTTRPLAFSARA